MKRLLTYLTRKRKHRNSLQDWKNKLIIKY